jgi:hypothetical protein
MSHARSDRARAYNQKFVMRQIELVHQRPQTHGINAAGWRDQTGSDLYHYAHELI